ncbi:hypothetical protein NGR_b16950 (plasmid) [Sinorhizobium fredii NGR234]|uniref:Uncharacterized protein n=1 Tax=Sinorhizobium fredii (strain NBRC 101917 / NGR234) TaxID=394 RepID=Q6W245_SINFN|nr:Hypothetical protein RNGR00148 [Sinorhizobium fredii NGR234]ACP23146.1 hypothetical protein NGR_b16950 [Sinorhizobium fredii NGR234]
MRDLLLYIVVLGCLVALDWTATEGTYSLAVWRAVSEQADSVRHQVEFLVDDIVRL